MNHQNKFFVVSLPRTGTQSICAMAEALGLRTIHSPCSTDTRDYDFFADTPFYAPSVIRDLVDDPNNYFIYVDFSSTKVANSWERVKLIQYYNRHLADSERVRKKGLEMDRFCYEQIFNKKRPIKKAHMIRAVKGHKKRVMSLVPENRLLLYHFNRGWKPLCDFLSKPIPKQDVPHIDGYS